MRIPLCFGTNARNLHRENGNWLIYQENDTEYRKEIVEAIEQKVGRNRAKAFFFNFYSFLPFSTIQRLAKRV